MDNDIDTAANMHSVDWQLLAAQIGSLADEDTRWLPVMANASSLLMETVPGINWVGFYLATNTSDGRRELVLGPFQGRVACVRIPFGRGVCGTAAAHDQTQHVDDVHSFPGHIACDAASRSEVVVPLHERSGQVAAVLDVDSPVPARFSEKDVSGLELVATTIEKRCDLGTWLL